MSLRLPRRWIVILTLMSVFALATLSQENSSEVPSLPIRVSTHMVLVDVVVTNKQGDPVSGLHGDDFTVEENGKEQKITAFTTPAESSTATALPPGIYSNRPEYRSPGGPITVMLLDVINTPFSDQAYARRQMLNFVREQYKPGQRMAVFTLTGSLNVLQDFTSDPAVLYAALQHFKTQQQEFTPTAARTVDAGASPATLAATVNTLDANSLPQSDATIGRAQAALASFEAIQVAYGQEQRTVLTLSALNSLARILGGLPGRKNIIWVTGSLPFSLIPENRDISKTELDEDLPSFDTRRVGEHSAGNYAATSRISNAEDIRQTAARLASSQVAIYPVDARGLSISTSSDAQEVMREMARETGGRAYVNQNEIKFGVQRAFLDESATYTLGYYPENKKWDGKYRNIKVKVKRDGVEVQNRRGYYASDPTQFKAYNPQQEVASALNDVVPSTLVAFTAQVRPANANSTSGKVGIDFLVDASTLSVEDTPAGKRFNVAFYASVFSSQGKMLAERSQKVDRSFPTDVYKQIVAQGMLLHIDMDPQPGNNHLRLAVQDNKTGLVGTIDATLTQ
jgi:VWFA-related protein